MSNKNLSLYFNPSAPATFSSALNDDWDDMDIPVRSVALSTKDDPKLLETENTFFQQLATLARARLEKDTDPIFTVALSDKDAIWQAFFTQLPPELASWWSCRCCESTLGRLAKLVQVQDDGTLRAVIWPDTEDIVPKHLLKSVRAVKKLVSEAKIEREFRVQKNDMCIGNETTGDFHHFFLKFRDSRLKRRTPGVVELATDDATRMLTRVLDDYSIDIIREAHRLLKGDKLHNASHHLAAITWLLGIHDDRLLDKAKTQEARANLITRIAAATWFQALSQLRSGALSTLLEDVKAGTEFGVIERKWNAINDPLQYLRPQAAPSAGNIAAAERLMKELNVTEHDMRRRQLTYSDIPDNVKIWQSRRTLDKIHTEPKADGIFSSVVPKAGREKEIKTTPTEFEWRIDSTPPTKITFSRLVTDVLPTTTKLEMHVIPRAPLCFFITGFKGTKPLMQWHSDSNLASWYYPGRAGPVVKHNLKPDTWNEVSCLMPFPHLWDGIPATTTFALPSEKTVENGFKYYHTKNGLRYLLCLKGVTQEDRRSLCLFPSLLKAEFHGVRSTIEAYSNKTNQEVVEDLEAKGGIVAGLKVDKSDYSVKLRVTDEKGGIEVYQIVLFD